MAASSHAGERENLERALGEQGATRCTRAALSGAETAEMARQVVHDFNNKLTRVLGLAELLRARPTLGADPERLREVADAILAAAAEAGEVVGRLRRVYGGDTRRERPHPADIGVVGLSGEHLSCPHKVTPPPALPPSDA